MFVAINLCCTLLSTLMFSVALNNLKVAVGHSLLDLGFGVVTLTVCLVADSCNAWSELRRGLAVWASGQRL